MAYACLIITATHNSTTANFFQKQVGDIFEYILYVAAMVLRLAYACGATHRVGQLLEQMDRLEKHPVSTNIKFEEDRITLKNVFGNPPIPTTGKGKGKGPSDLLVRDKKLFENVNLNIKKGDSTCVIGPSGCGKSSLLRVIAGLWGIDEGEITKPEKVGKGGVFFLPQRPYVFPGNLREQVLYPETPMAAGPASHIELKRVEEVLKFVHLQHLVDKYTTESVQSWSDVLSISEMQRLNFARMFFHQPVFCLADECTSALDLRLESYLYTQCEAKGITMISVAHRPTVVTLITLITTSS
jgi:ABC-type uncharacterized transport system fused permease/ATPase subunit